MWNSPYTSAGEGGIYMCTERVKIADEALQITHAAEWIIPAHVSHDFTTTQNDSTATRTELPLCS